MANKTPPLNRQIAIVDPDTGKPTQDFLTIWSILLSLSLSDLSDVVIEGGPADGQTLTYNATLKKWIPA